MEVDFIKRRAAITKSFKAGSGLPGATPHNDPSHSLQRIVGVRYLRQMGGASAPDDDEPVAQSPGRIPDNAKPPGFSRTILFITNRRCGEVAACAKQSCNSSGISSRVPVRPARLKNVASTRCNRRTWRSLRHEPIQATTLKRPR